MLQYYQQEGLVWVGRGGSGSVWVGVGSGHFFLFGFGGHGREGAVGRQGISRSSYGLHVTNISGVFTAT